MSGIFGVVSKKKCVWDFFYLGDYHSHLGTQFAGFAATGSKITRRIHDISYSQFKFKLFPDCQNLKSRKIIGAVGYEEQPIYVHSKFGEFCLATNGWIDNWRSLSQELMDAGFSFSEISDNRVNICELVSKLIIQKDNLVDGIQYMFSRIQGSISLLVLTRRGTYAVRDKNGVTPLVVGVKDGSWAVTTETTAFPNLGFKLKKYLNPGEIVLLTPDGLKTRKKSSNKLKICAFSWIYTGFPASSYEGINVELVREHCGKLLARGDKIKCDMSCGVPDSGTAHAVGYAIGKKIPFRRPLVKYTPGYGRSYLPPSQKVRDFVARMKLVPIKDIIDNQRIVLCDDSIVRGTQLKNFTAQKLWQNNAKEVHARIACPPLLFPCRYNLSTRSQEELVARRAIKAIEKSIDYDVSQYIDDNSTKYQQMIDWIARDIGVTSLKYQKVDDMVKAIGLPKDKLCLYCWRGKF